MHEYSPQTSDVHKKPRHPAWAKFGLAAVAGVVVLCLSFLGGIQFQKGKKTSDTAIGMQTMQNGDSRFSGLRQGQATMGGGLRRMGSFGEVSAINDTSLSFKGRGGGITTFTITSDTKITKDGEAAAVGDVKVGDTVMVSPSTTDTTAAASIAINPTIQGPADSAGGQST